ncbi:MAG: hypothetical protein IJ179_00485 [Oscillospiraceae bacterium]|nr:hypothetical protein [Oscillospiraceae bacterium]
MKRITALLLCLAMILALTGCGHEHTWVEATCTEPKTCSTCGATEGEALGHTWKDATCTEPKVCTVCGETEGDALGHTWAEATLTTPKTCTICGETEGEPLVVVPERPQIYDQDGFNVSYDEACVYLLALLRGDVAKYKMGVLDKMTDVEFSDDFVDTIDPEIARDNAHRYLYVDGKYAGVILAAHNDDGSVVTGESTFDQILICQDDNIESDAQSSSFFELTLALYYLCSASRSEKYDCLSPIKTLMNNYDKLIPIGKPNPLAVILVSDPIQFGAMELG